MAFLNTSIWISAAFLLTGLVANGDPVDDYLKGEMAKENVPGVSLAVVKEGKTLKVQGYGFANVELGVPVTSETRFEIGSVTKQFTASLIMLLAEEGKLSLDDTIQKHLAGLPTSWSGITLRHLLTHTSGITNYNSLSGFEVARRLNATSFTRQISKYPLMFKAGDHWSYGNSAFSLLGYTIEKLTGKSYWDVLSERIFKPAGMSNSRSRDATAVITSRASGYEFEGGRLVNRDSDLTDVFSAGAIVSTAPDGARTQHDQERILAQVDRALDEFFPPAQITAAPGTQAE